MKRILLLITILPVLVVVILVFTSSGARTGSVSQLPISKDLDDYLGISEFSYSDVPLGSNEAIEEKTLDTLQFDDYLLRQYDIGDSELVLFIAYWSPTNATQRLAGQHNPDICWVKSGGWEEIRRISGARFLVQGLRSQSKEAFTEFDGQVASQLTSSSYRLDTLSSPNALLQTPSPKSLLEPRSSNLEPDPTIGPVEYRYLKDPTGSNQFHTYFWQVLENEVKPIERVGPGSYWEYFKTIPDRIRAKRYPMWFIRIHSKIPLAPVISQSEMMNNSEGLMAGGISEDTLAAGSSQLADVDSQEQEARSKELGMSLEGSVGRAEQNNLNKTHTSDLVPHPSKDTKYLVDYPEVLQLLLSIHEMTTGES